MEDAMDCAEQKAQLSIKLPASALDGGEAVEQVSMRAAVPVVEGTLKLQGASKWSADMWLGRSRTPGVNSLLPPNMPACETRAIHVIICFAGCLRPAGS